MLFNVILFACVCGVSNAETSGTPSCRAKYPLVDDYVCHLKRSRWTRESIELEVSELNRCSRVPSIRETIAVTAAFTPIAGPLAWMFGAGMAADHYSCLEVEQRYNAFAAEVELQSKATG